MAQFIRSTTVTGIVPREEVVFQSENNKNTVISGGRVLDSEWAKRTFMTTGKEYTTKYDRDLRKQTTVDNKFYDTTMGGNISANARPQYTRFSDVRHSGLLYGRNPVGVGDNGGNHGMGRMYSEHLDDNREVVYFRMGVPEFNSMDSFLQNFSNPTLVSLATKGTTSNKLGEWVGAGLAWIVTLGVTNVTGKVLVGVSKAISVSGILANNTSRFYKLRPMMSRYWASVSIIVNLLMVNEGFIAKSGNEDKENPNGIDPKDMEHLHDLMPDVFTKYDGIDVASIVSRCQRRTNLFMDRTAKTYNQDTGLEEFRYGKKPAQLLDISTDLGDTSLVSRLQQKEDGTYFVRGVGSLSDLKDSVTESIQELIFGRDEKGDINKEPKDSSLLAEVNDYFKAEWAEGSAFSTLEFDHIGDVTDSFSNNIKESPLSSKFNSASSTGRDIRFSFAGGNIGSGLVADTIESIFSFVDGVIGGAAKQANDFTFGISGAIYNMWHGTNMVTPKIWDTSTADFPTYTYKTTLISPSQHPIARLQNIYMPLAMMMGMVLPLKTGKQSYTSPFTMSVWHRGKAHMPLAMATSLSISRGGSDQGYDDRGRPLSLEVTMTVANLDTAMPVTIGAPDSSVREISRALNDDNAMTEWLEALSGMGMEENLYLYPKGRLRARKALVSIGTAWSPANNVMWFNNWLHNGAINTLTSPVASLGEALSRDSATIQR